MTATAIRHDDDFSRIQGPSESLDPVTDNADEEAAAVTPMEGFEVELSSGEILCYATAEALHGDLIEGRVPRTSRARNLAVPTATDGASAWHPVETLAVAHPELRAAYRPVWHQALRFMGYGAIVGIVLKLLDTTVLMFAIDESIGMIWLVVVASLVLSSRWSLAPLAALYLTIQVGAGNLFFTALTSGLVGLAFGLPIGLLIGTLVGHARKSSAQVAPDASPEGNRPYLLGIVAPALFLSVAVPAYVWFNLWMLAQWS